MKGCGSSHDLIRVCGVTGENNKVLVQKSVEIQTKMPETVGHTFPT
jgi:hypothetical protein